MPLATHNSQQINSQTRTPPLRDRHSSVALRFPFRSLQFRWIRAFYRMWCHPQHTLFLIKKVTEAAIQSATTSANIISSAMFSLAAFYGSELNFLLLTSYIQLKAVSSCSWVLKNHTCFELYMARPILFDISERHVDRARVGNGQCPTILSSLGDPVPHVRLALLLGWVRLFAEHWPLW